MRLALGFVLGWFGVNELRNPADWAVFVPTFVSDHSPVAVNDLILLHGFLLLLAAAAVTLGLFYLLGSLLAMGLLADIVLGLWLDGGVNDLVIRDIGLFALAAALALDHRRFWHMDSVIAEWLLRQRSKPKKGRPPLPQTALWAARTGSGILLVTAVLGLGFILHSTGGSGAPLPGDSAAVIPAGRSSGPASTGQAASPTPSETPATPAPSTSHTLFASWQYRQYAFQVYPGPISSDAEEALAGFDFSVQDQGNQVLLVFKALSSRYSDATVPIDPKDTAYFIETSMRDDPNKQENNLRDDGVIVVDPQGYIVNLNS
jgi:hypothetical protein